MVRTDVQYVHFVFLHSDIPSSDYNNDCSLNNKLLRLPPFAVLYARSPLVEEVEDAAVRTFIAASAGNQPGQLRLAIPFLAARLFTRGACTPDIEQISPLEGENKIRTPRSQRPSPAALTTRGQGTHFLS